MQINDSQAIGKLLRSPKKIVITMHQKPDGDAIGSTLGLQHYLRQVGHDIEIISPTDFPENLNWMPEALKITIGPDDELAATRKFLGADIIFCLDHNDLKRIQPFDEAVEVSKAIKIMMDHHTYPKDFYDYAVWDDEACSTTEMVFRLMTDLGHKKYLNKDVAVPLYAGTLTDSGSFRFPSTSAAVHRMVADLIEAGADNFLIYDNLFANDDEKRLRLTGHCLGQRMRVLPEYAMAYFWLTADDVENFQVGSGDTEGLVNYGLSLKDINFSVFMAEKDDMTKMSFRSRGTFKVNEFASAHFSGGGHRNAAGGRNMASVEETIQKLLGLLEKNKEDLLASWAV